MRRKQNHGRRAKHLRRTKGTMSSIKGVSHLSRRAKRRLYCKLQLWMWRKRREKCRFAMFKGKKQTRLISPSSRTQGGPSDIVSSNPLGCEGTPKRHDSVHKPCEHSSRSEAFASSAVTDAYVPTLSVTASPGAKTEAQQREITNHSRLSKTAEPLLETFPPLFKEPTALDLSQRLKVNGVLGPLSSAPLDRERAANGNTVQGVISKMVHTDADLHALRNYIQEFLDNFYRFYGSFIPLQKRDVLAHLKTRFKTDFKDRKNAIFPEVARYLTEFERKPLPSFRLAYKKHTLTLDDLSTLADQNWLNDQVMNMYGELIMESADHQVHFLNSFFHRQLMTKGYDGVKRWTKQVDLFSKSLLLVPIHLEVHWCLVVADNARKKICLYDSQGNALQKVARNILKYLTREAKERKQTAFEHGWAVSSGEKIPQQTNENDCGVFVLEYSRCLAQGKPLQFSQKDIPKIRKRIYRELCDCRLGEDG